MVRVVTLSVVASAAAVATWASKAPAPAPTPPAEVRVHLNANEIAAQVDPRFLSFAIDTAQVVGGDFWAPPGQGKGVLRLSRKEPYDFSRPRLRTLTAGLAPAYLRIGGTDADRTIYDLGNGPGQPPGGGARWVLTRARWDQVNAFATATDLRIMFTLNAGPSARDAQGDWDADNARALIKYSTDRKYPVDVWELGNEINGYPLLHRTWLTSAQYAEDLRRAHGLLRELVPGAKLAGPSSAFWPILGEGRAFQREVLERAGQYLDVVTWHHYPQQSFRCPVATRRAKAGQPLGPEALADVEKWAARVEAPARQHAPGAQVWLGETGSAQCGGQPGFSNAFADLLWWLDGLGRMARRGQAVVVRQTLSGSDYGLLDEGSLEPNPSYWASWLWRRLMGTRVLAANVTPEAAALRVYAHCARDVAPGAITLLLINVHPTAPVALPLPAGPALSVRLSAPELTSRQVLANGEALRLAGDDLPELPTLLTPVSGPLQLPGSSATFVVLPQAQARACL